MRVTNSLWVERIRLDEDETIDGNLSVFGGAVSLEKGSTVNGNVVLIGGTINAAGTINGGINGLGGSITLGDTAVVQGDVITLWEPMLINQIRPLFRERSFHNPRIGVEIPDVPQIIAPAIFKPLNDAMGALLRSLVIALLAVLVTLFSYHGRPPMSKMPSKPIQFTGGRHWTSDLDTLPLRDRDPGDHLDSDPAQPDRHPDLRPWFITRLDRHWVGAW